MEDALAILKDRLAKAETRAQRAEKAWESAKTEVADLQTTLRVMLEISGESSGSSSSPQPSATVSERQTTIIRLLSIGEPNALAPAELYEMYKLLGSEEINIDTFRTTIWRMRDSAFQDNEDMWLVKGDGGRYWKEPGIWRRQEADASR